MLGFYQKKKRLQICYDNQKTGKNQRLCSGDGWEHVYISISIENQEMADIRLKHFLEAPVKHREVFCSPLIGPISLGKYLDTGLIKCVNVGGEMAPKKMLDRLSLSGLKAYTWKQKKEI